MTVSSQTSRVSYAGNGSTTAFAVSFYFLADSHLKVILRAADGSETVKTLTTDYTVSGAGNPSGGTVTMLAAPASGTTLVIVRNVPLTQETDYQANDDFPAESHERALDKLTMEVQQLQEQTDRAIKVPITNPTSIAELTADLIRLADSADNIDTVANNIVDVNTTADNIADVNTVAGSIADVNATGQNIAAVITVANDLNEPVSEIETVANSIANVNTVGNNITNVNTVGTNIANVNTVATNIADIVIAADNVVDITNFADVYQGGKAADPTLRNDGSALQIGDMYFNTTVNELRLYGGTAWIAGTAGTLAVQRFSGTGSAVNFTLATAPPGENNTQVYINGVYQQKDTYGVTGTTLTFSTAPPAGTDNIEVVTISTLALGQTTASLVSITDSGNYFASGTVEGALQEAAQSSTTRFLQAGTGASSRDVQSKLRDIVSVLDFGADPTGVTDSTQSIQNAINSIPAGGGSVYVPRGLYLVDPAVGINVVTGLTLFGDGRSSTQFVAKPVGGTIIKRAFNPSGPNAYVDGVVVRDIGIILRHPAVADPSNYYQVAIQFRHITRSLIEDVYIGNYPTGVSSALTQPATQSDSRQGYAVSFGSTGAGDPAYAGGEVNTARRVMCAGVRYGFTIDNPTFNTPYGGSAAYTCVVDCCEVSAAEVGISQYGQYGAGCTFSNNVIQAIDQMRGSVATAYSVYIDGYEHLLFGGYNESPYADYELYFSSSSKRNRALTWLSDDGPFYDGGTGNVYERIDGTTNKFQFSVNKRDFAQAFAKAWVSFYWDGSAVVINASYGISGVVRIGAGDYRIDFLAGVMTDANYTAGFGCEVNASGHPGTANLYSGKSTSNCRMLTYNITSAAYQDFLENTVSFFGNK